MLALRSVIVVYLELPSRHPDIVVYLKLPSGHQDIVVHLKLPSRHQDIVVYLRWPRRRHETILFEKRHIKYLGVPKITSLEARTSLNRKMQCVGTAPSCHDRPSPK